MVVDNKTMAALYSPNALIRRQALFKIAAEGDSTAIPVLGQYYKNEKSEDLRELAKSAAKQIRERQNAPITAESSRPAFVIPDDPNMPISEGLKVGKGFNAAVKNEIRRLDAQRNIRLFSIAVVLVGVIVVAVVMGSQVLRIAQQQVAVLNIERAVELPASGAGDALDGGFYKGTLASGTVFYVSEPKAAIPSNGVIAIIGLTNGDVANALALLNDKTQAAGIVLVVPQLKLTSEGKFDTNAALGDLRDLVGRLATTYTLNRAALTLYGSGNGAEVAAQFVASYPREVAIVSLSNGVSYPTPARNSAVQFIIIAGAQDPATNDAAIALKTSLDAFNKTVISFQVLRDYGNVEIPSQAKTTVDHLQSLKVLP